MAAQLLERNAVILGSDRMFGRRFSFVGNRRVRFGSLVRTINRRCTIFGAMYDFFDLIGTFNWNYNREEDIFRPNYEFQIANI